MNPFFFLRQKDVTVSTSNCTFRFVFAPFYPRLGRPAVFWSLLTTFNKYYNNYFNYDGAYGLMDGQGIMPGKERVSSSIRLGW
jgi:hypothetical protein